MVRTNVYDKLLYEVENGKRFNIDFKTQSIKVGNEYLIKDGRTLWTNDNLGVPKMSVDEILNKIEELYKEYKYSLPSERSESLRRKYFYAVPVDELSVEQMCVGTSREYAQAKLEAFLLLEILSGYFYWQDKLGKWYWHGKDKDLIILKGWC